MPLALFNSATFTSARDHTITSRKDRGEPTAAVMRTKRGSSANAVALACRGSFAGGYTGASDAPHATSLIGFEDSAPAGDIDAASRAPLGEMRASVPAPVTMR